MQQEKQQAKRKYRINAKTASAKEYIRYVEHLYLNRQGNTLARYLCLSDDHISNMALWTCDIARDVAGKCVAPLDQMLVFHLLCVKAVRNGNHTEANNHQVAYVTSLVKCLQSQIGCNWMLPVMYAACADLRSTTQKAELAIGNPGELVDRAAESLIACFRVCADDTDSPKDGSKLLGLLNPVNHLLKMYFKVQKFGICRSVIKIIEPAVISMPFSVSEEVTFRFYIGRLAMMDGDFRKANKHLFFAYRKCHPQSYKNRRIIVSFLIPVKMLLGYFPPRDLIEKYSLPIFWHLVSAVKEGQIKTFEEILEHNNAYFASMGLMSTLENLRMVTYRNVLKKVFHSLNSFNVPLASFQAGLRMMADSQVDLTETQSIVAAMIFNNKINAYLSYQYQTVVFNPNMPFPRLSKLCTPKFN